MTVPQNFVSSGNGGPIADRIVLAADTGAPAGNAVQFGVSVAGTVVVTLTSGNTMTLNLAVGDNIYPYAVTKYASGGSATITQAYNLVK